LYDAQEKCFRAMGKEFHRVELKFPRVGEIIRREEHIGERVGIIVLPAGEIEGLPGEKGDSIPDLVPLAGNIKPRRGER